MGEEEGKSKGIAVNPHSQYYYGTFQGVANYHPPPPPPPQPIFGFPQPVPPSQYYHGYQNMTTGYAIMEGGLIREDRLPCCGMGMGWFLFIVGFFLGGIPWYVGTFLLLCARLDYREKPGYVACAIASILSMIVVTLGAAKGAHTWPNAFKSGIKIDGLKFLSSRIEETLMVLKVK